MILKLFSFINTGFCRFASPTEKTKIPYNKNHESKLKKIVSFKLCFPITVAMLRQFLYIVSSI